MTTLGTFPFGQPLRLCEPRRATPAQLFILGAYPSALHVAWTPPTTAPKAKRIQALAVDNEPTPFWDGTDAATYFQNWKSAVNFDAAWGSVALAAPRFNGPSGQWVRDHILTPLGCTQANAWITDCLDTYHMSMGVAARIEDTYNVWATTAKIVQAVLPTHPNEETIVTTAIQQHATRLRAELAAAQPQQIVTLGNAALRVLRALLADTAGLPTQLAPNAHYGQVYDIVLPSGLQSQWLPLAHPAAPTPYQAAHTAWETVCYMSIS